VLRQGDGRLLYQHQVRSFAYPNWAELTCEALRKNIECSSIKNIRCFYLRSSSCGARCFEPPPLGGMPLNSSASWLEPRVLVYVLGSRVGGCRVVYFQAFRASYGRRTC
jgi:hypothetical protein